MRRWLKMTHRSRTTTETVAYDQVEANKSRSDMENKIMNKDPIDHHRPNHLSKAKVVQGEIRQKIIGDSPASTQCTYGAREKGKFWQPIGSGGLRLDSHSTCQTECLKHLLTYEAKNKILKIK